MSLHRNFLCGALALLALLALAASAPAQEHNSFPRVEARAASTQCNAGVVYDDNAFEEGYSLGSGNPGDSTMVTKLALPAGTRRLDQVCLCFARLSNGPGSMDYEVVVYDDDGPGGEPGTLLGSVPASISSFPSVDTPFFFSVNTAGATISLPDTSVYVGARWPGGLIAMCGDRSGSTPQRVSYNSPNSGLSWADMATTFPSAPPRAMGIRVDPSTTAGPATCFPDGTTLCLNNGRFEVKATYETSGGLSGSARMVKLTDETGYLWFFSAGNVEAVVKVLDGCALNDRYWVFAGGLTDVRTVITVRDVQNQTTKTYTNPQGTPFQPIQDTSALACP